MERVEVRTGDGRLLEAAIAGPPQGRPLIFHTGTPSFGAVYEPLIEAGAARGLRHIAYCRPGYGDSERLPGRSVADCAGDVAAVADQLGIERFFTVGWSGGGPHALACAALLPERTLAAATLASVAPVDAEGLDFMAGMGEENVAEFGAALAGEAPLTEMIDQFAAELVAVTPEAVAESLGDLIDEVDRGALTGDLAAYLADCMKGALRTGPSGWIDDDLAFAKPWGFDLGAIERPVAIWQGAHDRMVPFAHGRWLAAHVAGAQARLLDDEGHVSLVERCYPVLLDELLAAA